MSVFCTALFDWIIYRCTDFGKKTAEVISFSVLVALLGIISAVIILDILTYSPQILPTNGEDFFRTVFSIRSAVCMNGRGIFIEHYAWYPRPLSIR